MNPTLGEPLPTSQGGRGALGLFCMMGFSLALMGCSASADRTVEDEEDTSEATTVESSTTTTLAESGASKDASATGCTPTPLTDIGPNDTDTSAAGFARGDLVSNIDGTQTQVGIPLTLTILVVDGENVCAPYEGARVDVWQADAAGVYSDQDDDGTAGESWLRGWQRTDADGKAVFTTIVPGWQDGRTNHVHLRVSSAYDPSTTSTDGANTTELFFAQPFVDRLATTVAPYKTEGQNPVSNLTDPVFAKETKGANVLTLTGTDEEGYTGVATIVLPIAAPSS